MMPPCPTWCTNDHAPGSLGAYDEKTSGERFHSANIGWAGPAAVDVVRVDLVDGGQLGVEHLDVGWVDDLTAADAVALAGLLQTGARVLDGSLPYAVACQGVRQVA